MTTFAIENAPQTRRKDSTFFQMMELYVCLDVLWIVAMIFYGVTRGGDYALQAFYNGLVGLGFSVLGDALWEIRVFFDKSVDSKDKAKEYFYRIGHSYSYISGIILTLLCPIGILWWELAITAFISTFVMKLLFGGFGSNILNPAVFGRVFAQLCFASDMVTYLGEKPADYTVSTGASVTSKISANTGFGVLINSSNENYISLGDIILGKYYGALGETFFLVLLVIAVFLIVRKVIDWRVPVTYILSLYLCFLLMFLCAGDGGYAFQDALSYTLIGGIVFGGVICLTDPVTSPTSRAGRVIFALTAALITALLRLYTNAPEGVAYSILIVNVLTPFIDKIIKGRTRNKLVPIVVSSCLLAAVLIVGIVFGATHPLASDGSFVTALA